jgi:hypothetical protein
MGFELSSHYQLLALFDPGRQMVRVGMEEGKLGRGNLCLPWSSQQECELQFIVNSNFEIFLPFMTFHRPVI